MQRAILALVGVLTLSVAAWAQQAPQQAPTTQPSAAAMSDMMKQCMQHFEQSQTHIEAAIKSEDAGKHEETKQNLAQAKQQLSQGMQMMATMQKMHASHRTSGMQGMQGMHGMQGGMASEGGKTVWTCPMHPQVKQETAGKCPQCKMDLVQAKPEGAHQGGQH